MTADGLFGGLMLLAIWQEVQKKHPQVSQEDFHRMVEAFPEDQELTALTMGKHIQTCLDARFGKVGRRP